MRELEERDKMEEKRRVSSLEPEGTDVPAVSLEKP